MRCHVKENAGDGRLRFFHTSLTWQANHGKILTIQAIREKFKSCTEKSAILDLHLSQELRLSTD